MQTILIDKHISFVLTFCCYYNKLLNFVEKLLKFKEVFDVSYFSIHILKNKK